MMKYVFPIALWSLLTINSNAADDAYLTDNSSGSMEEREMSPNTLEDEVLDDFIPDFLSLSLSTYGGVPKEQIFPCITQEFPQYDLIRMGIVGGWTKSGLGQINQSYPWGKKPFYLINIEPGSGVDCSLDWTTKDLPEALINQFHVLILEQVECDTLISPMTYRNAFLALKPGGYVFFNTYRPSDYYLSYQNYMVSPGNKPLPPHIKAFATSIDTQKGKSWGHLRDYFASHLKDAGFSKIFYESSVGFDLSAFCMASPVIKNSDCFSQGGYNSGGWAAGFKRSLPKKRGK